jgi:hypothetical protein
MVMTVQAMTVPEGGEGGKDTLVAMIKCEKGNAEEFKIACEDSRKIRSSVLQFKGQKSGDPEKYDGEFSTAPKAKKQRGIELLTFTFSKPVN